MLTPLKKNMGSDRSVTTSSLPIAVFRGLSGSLIFSWCREALHFYICRNSLLWGVQKTKQAKKWKGVNPAFII
jgi:hypothetical protein